MSGHYDNSFGPLWVFWKEIAAFPFLLGSHHPVQFHQIRLLIIGMAVNTSRTLPVELSEHSLLQSGLGLLIQLSNDRGTFFCSHRIWSLMAETALLRVTAGWLQSKAWKKCTRVHLPAPYDHSFSMCLFWKHRYSLTNATKSPGGVIPPTQGDNYGRTAHRTFFTEVFSKKLYSVFLESWPSSEPVWKCFSEHRTQGLKRKQYFHLTKLEYLQSPAWWKSTRGVIFPFFRTASLIKYFYYLGEALCLPLLDGKSSDSTVFAE